MLEAGRGRSVKVVCVFVNSDREQCVFVHCWGNGVAGVCKMRYAETASR